jgi:hypothetical protein
MANPRIITTTVLDESTHRCILLSLSRDDEAIVCKVRKHGPVLLFATDDVHRRLRDLALDASVPQYKGDGDSNAIGSFFSELGRSISELAPADARAALPRPRRIAVMLTVDGEHLMIEAPPRLPMRLRPDQTFAKLVELVDDASIPDASADSFDARRFFRGAGKALGELNQDDEKA